MKVDKNQYVANFKEGAGMSLKHVCEIVDSNMLRIGFDRNVRVKVINSLRAYVNSRFCDVDNIDEKEIARIAETIKEGTGFEVTYLERAKKQGVKYGRDWAFSILENEIELAVQDNSNVDVAKLVRDIKKEIYGED